MAMSDNFPLIPIPGRDGLWHIYARSPGGGGDAFAHLIPGKDAAILYDTGFGIGDLKSMVESLTDLPIIVVNSHNHGDHTLGNPQFSKVHIPAGRHRNLVPFHFYICFLTIKYSSPRL